MTHTLAQDKCGDDVESTNHGVYMRRFEPVAEEIPRARAFVRDRLEGLPEYVRDAVSVMVSELSTNAFLYARTPFEVRLVRSERCVRVEVSDLGTGRPERHPLLPTEAHGRGLQIVADLSEDWGVVPAPGGRGKSVWFTVRLAGNN